MARALSSGQLGVLPQAKFLDNEPGNFGISELNALLVTLSKKRLECALREDYVAAEDASVRLVDIQREIGRRQEAHLQAAQEKQVLALSKAHERELETYRQRRQRALLDDKLRASRVMRSLADNHEKELLAKRAELERETSSVHFSAPVLELRKVERVVSHEGRFAEAGVLSRRASDRESQEARKHLLIQEVKARQAIERLVDRQRSDQEQLIVRLELETDKLQLSLDQERDRIIQRYRNLVTELQTQHNIAIAALARKNENKVQTFKSVKIAATAF